MFGYIYKTTNLINGKIYVGQRKGDFTNKYLGSGTILKKAIKKYGRENFSVQVLDYGVDRVHLNLLEKWWIAYLNSRDIEVGYNIQPGGQGSNLTHGRVYTEEWRHNISIAHLGKHLSQEHRDKISASNKGKKRTMEYREKLRMSATGRHHTQETKEKLRQTNLGKRQSAEAREKKRLAMLGRKHTEESKQKMRDAIKRRKLCQIGQ